MLVINTDSRQKCDRIVVSLRDIYEIESESYFSKGCPKSPSEQSSPVENAFVLFPHPVMDNKEMRSSKAPFFGRLRGESTFMVASGSSRDSIQQRTYNKIGEALASRPARQTSPLARRRLPLEIGLRRFGDECTAEAAVGDTQEDADDEQETDEETPLLPVPDTSQAPYDTQRSSYLTPSPEPVQRPAFISDFGGHFTHFERPSERTELGNEERGDIDEDEISLSEPLLLEPSSNDNVNSTPESANELSGSLHQRESAWRGAIELLWNISGWFGRWFCCVSPRARSSVIR